MKENENRLKSTRVVLQDPASVGQVAKASGVGSMRSAMELSEDNLVEAAGVEPASEKARREENYVRFRFGSCRPPH